MKKVTVFFTLLLLLSSVLKAEVLRFRAPSLSGKLIANNIALTDWQTVMSCQYLSHGQKKEIVRYPSTHLNKLSTGQYALKIRAQALGEFSLNSEISNCFYKLILIGKNTQTHQLAFGEVLLLGKESGTMNESELLSLFDMNQNARVLHEKVRELTITNGKDGGIVEEL